MTSSHPPDAVETTPWREVEIRLEGERDRSHPYTEIEVWADFVHESGGTLRRPAFWDGGRTWRVRFTSPGTTGTWSWTSDASEPDAGLVGSRGSVLVRAADTSGHRFNDHGFWRMSAGGRSLVHADGRPAVLVGDTAWALPWRATEEQVRIYTADRAAKGFNAVLLITVQPDLDARGPRDRTADEGFDVGFEDLPDGHINELVPAYFQYLDRLLDILGEHQLVPVLSPLFHGFGWKGLRVSGPVIPPAEFARYCRYLVARYGARPAIYLVGADGSGTEPQIDAGGREVQAWDAYGQPTGIHYQPHGMNRSHQDSDWLDFQWCQTGHQGEHVQERVADLWRNLPAKGVANAEPTYEHSGRTGNGEGWWQGHEAWSNLCAGGTMGVVYGAGSMWQWRLHADEPGHAPFFLAPGAGWREALDFEGSRYVGLVSRILDGLPTTDMEPNWRLAFSARGLAVPGRLLICYREFGGSFNLTGYDDSDVPRNYRVIDPRTGALIRSGVRAGGREVLPDLGIEPRLVIFCDETQQ